MAAENMPGESNALVVQIPCVVFLAVTPCFIAARFWSRYQSASRLGWDDWCCLVSWVFCQLVSGLMLGSCAYGFGQHIYNLPPANRTMTLKLFFMAQIFYKLTMNLTKISILLLYMRIFAVFTWFRWVGRSLIAVVGAYMLAAFFAAVFQCTPVGRAWDRSLPGTCISIERNWYANAAFSIATDAVILLLPIKPILSLRLPAGDKIAVLGVFVLGAFVTMTSILRMQTLKFSSTSPDTTYDIASSMWTIIEDNTAIICACLPMCKRPLAALFPFSAFAGPHNLNNMNEPSRRSSGSRKTWTHLFDEACVAKGRELPVLDPRDAFTHSQVHAGHCASDEFILAPVHNGSRPDSSQGSHSEEGGGTIRRVMRYEVAYDDAPVPPTTAA